MSISTVRSGLVVLAAVMLSGCAAYVNIPSQAGDVARHDANIPTVQKVSVAGIQAVFEDRPIGSEGGQYTLVLPQGTLPSTYQVVLAKLGGATIQVDPAIPVIEARQVRIRADLAEVDVIRPANVGETRGPGQMVTVYLRWDPFLGWVKQRLHVYSVTVDQNIPEPGYADLPVIEPAPVEQAAPIAEPAPVEESTPIEQPAPIEEFAPLEEPAPSEQPAPEVPDAPAEEPSAEEAPGA